MIRKGLFQRAMSWWSNVRAFFSQLFTQSPLGISAPPSKRIKALQDALDKDGYWGALVAIPPRFFNPFSPPDNKPLEWLMGFTGSAGVCVVTREEALLFVDGRYTEQALQEVKTHGVSVQPVEALTEWIVGQRGREDILIYDPWAHSISQIEQYQKLVAGHEMRLMPLCPHPIEILRAGSKPPAGQPVTIHPLHYAGLDSHEKRVEFVKNMGQTDICLLTQGDSIAWLLNIRGNDIPYIPVPQAYALVYRDQSIDLFIDPAKISGEVLQHLRQVSIFPLNTFTKQLSNQSVGKRILLDPQHTPQIITTFLQEATVVYQTDPCLLPKSKKNTTELQHIKDSHHIDGLALTRFLYWVAHIPLEGAQSECTAAEKLFALRAQGQHFHGLSFPTISAYGPHSALIHYQPGPQSNLPLMGSGFYLVDSGGQYKNGCTTDVTRTVFLGGTPTNAQREHFTRVLKGHIDLAKAIFPRGTRGIHLDVLARRSLWSAGLNYPHGTGHGVGSFLCVHEGPQSISQCDNGIALEPGMILSNEPGYYQKDTYGIRLENLMVVKADPGIETMLGFETLTLAPFDSRSIVSDMLTPEQKNWLNAYHAQIYEAFHASLEDDVRLWLKKQTNPLD